MSGAPSRVVMAIEDQMAIMNLTGRDSVSIVQPNVAAEVWLILHKYRIRTSYFIRTFIPGVQLLRYLQPSALLRKTFTVDKNLLAIWKTRQAYVSLPLTLL